MLPPPSPLLGGEGVFFYLNALQREVVKIDDADHAGAGFAAGMATAGAAKGTDTAITAAHTLETNLNILVLLGRPLDQSLAGYRVNV